MDTSWVNKLSDSRSDNEQNEIDQQLATANAATSYIPYNVGYWTSLMLCVLMPRVIQPGKYVSKQGLSLYYPRSETTVKVKINKH